MRFASTILNALPRSAVTVVFANRRVAAVLVLTIRSAILPTTVIWPRVNVWLGQAARAGCVVKTAIVVSALSARWPQALV